MKKEKKSAGKKTGGNLYSLLLNLNIIYTVFAVIICAIACVFTFRERRQQVISLLDAAFVRVCGEYKSILDNYWQVYMPIFEDSDNTYEILHKYFGEGKALTYNDRGNLYTALREILVRNNGLQFIGLYSPERADNYLLLYSETSLSDVKRSESLIRELRSEDHIETRRLFHIPGQGTLDAALCVISPAPYPEKYGVILAGFSLNSFNVILKDMLSLPESFRIRILRDHQIVYDSGDAYDADIGFQPPDNGTGVYHSGDDTFYYRSAYAGDNLSVGYYSVMLSELNRLGNAQTMKIILVSMAVWILPMIVQLFILKFALRGVSVIQSGLNRMNDNAPNYKLPDNLYGELSQIASEINEMSDRLDEHMRKAYYYELKEKDARMAELQASFNPHFLYNTLEMLRSKSYANGDEETSELIAQLSALFRGLIGNRTFISLREELAFGSRYFALLNARYGDSVEVEYDIDNEWLDLGIIRNTFQIIIENYFVHGFEEDKEDKYIHISGVSEDGDGICFIVEDNGRGMDDEALARLQRSLLEPIGQEEKSYGLKNLSQRIKLFYGDNYGVAVGHSADGGLRVEIHMRKMRVDDKTRPSIGKEEQADKILGPLIQ